MINTNNLRDCADQLYEAASELDHTRTQRNIAEDRVAKLQKVLLMLAEKYPGENWHLEDI